MYGIIFLQYILNMSFIVLGILNLVSFSICVSHLLLGIKSKAFYI